MKSVGFSDGKSVPYTIRESSRARRVSLKFTALDGLVVIVPSSYDVKNVPLIVERKKDWISRVAGQFRERMEVLASESVLPDSVTLHATKKYVQIQYLPSSRPFSVRDREDMLTVAGRYDAERVQAYLRQWLRRQARQHLVPLFLEFARAQAVTVSGVNIRLQRGRWGSCSAAGVINLNARLMFLPEEMARYVCMHELAHCTHHNHSKAFWSHLEAIMPGAGRIDRLLRDAWKYVPGWAYA